MSADTNRTTPARAAGSDMMLVLVVCVMALLGMVAVFVLAA